jgi:hypothetical protein
MSVSNDFVSEYEVDDVSKDDTGDDQKDDADTIICTVTVQSSSTWWNRSLTIPS